MPASFINKGTDTSKGGREGFAPFVVTSLPRKVYVPSLPYTALGFKLLFQDARTRTLSDARQYLNTIKAINYEEILALLEAHGLECYETS
jgi:hypothetical protein